MTRSRIIIEIEDSASGAEEPPKLPLFAEPDKRLLSRFLAELDASIDYARKKIGADVHDESLASIVIATVYLKLLALRGFVRDVETERSLFEFIEEHVLASETRAHLKDEVLEVLLEPLALLQIERKALVGFPLGRLLSLLSEYDLALLGADLLGAIRQAVLVRGKRKRMGAYYTPPTLAEFMIEQLELEQREESLDPSFTVLDPCCGSGMFLLAAIKRIAQLLAERQNLHPDTAVVRACGSHVLGFDTDPLAVAIAKMNLLLRLPKKGVFPPPVFLFDPLRQEEDFFTDRKLRRRVLEGFEYIVGNPPWRQLKRAEQKLYKGWYLFAQGRQANLFGVFLENSLRRLKPGGRLIFLVPEAFLNLQSYIPLRKYVLEQGKVFLVAYCGQVFANVFAPSVILGIERPRSPESEVKTKVCENPLAEACRLVELPPDRYAQDPEAIFTYLYDPALEEVCELMERLEEATTLEGQALWALGIVTGNNKKFIADRKLDDRYVPILVGKDIDRYRIDYSGHWLLYEPERLQQVAPEELFRAKEKLVYRFIGNTLRFAYDTKGYFTLNNANVVIPQIKGVPMLYVLALLNSSLLSFYHYYRYFTVKVLRSRLERLPLAMPPKRVVKRVASLARRAVRAASSNDANKFAKLDAQIDDEVFKIYGIPAPLVERVRKWLKTRHLR